MRGAGNRIKLGFGDEAALIVVGVGEAGAVRERHGGLAATVATPNNRRHTPREVSLLEEVTFAVVHIQETVDEVPRTVDEGFLVALNVLPTRS